MNISDENKEIILRAEKISAMIKESPIYKKYLELTEEIKNDYEATNLLSVLVEKGEEINQNKDNGIIDSQDSYERMVLREKLDNNKIVKQFLSAQMEYISMIEAIRDELFGIINE